MPRVLVTIGFNFGTKKAGMHGSNHYHQLILGKYGRNGKIEGIDEAAKRVAKVAEKNARATLKEFNRTLRCLRDC